MRQQSLDPAEQKAVKARYPEIFSRRNSSPSSFADIERPFNVTKVDFVLARA